MSQANYTDKHIRRCASCPEEIPEHDSCDTCGGERCATCCYFAAELAEVAGEDERETRRQVDAAFERLLSTGEVM